MKVLQETESSRGAMDEKHAAASSCLPVQHNLDFFFSGSCAFQEDTSMFPVLFGWWEGNQMSIIL